MKWQIRINIISLSQSMTKKNSLHVTTHLLLLQSGTVILIQHFKIKFV